MIDEVDIDGNGVIEFNDFVGLMVRKLKEVDASDELKEVFHVMD